MSQLEEPTPLALRAPLFRRYGLTAVALGAAIASVSCERPAPCEPGEIRDGAGCVATEVCGVRPWGVLADAPAVFVSADAPDGGGGTLQAPYSSIGAAVERAAALGGDRLVAVDRGTYFENLVLRPRHSGVTIAGRCAQMVTIDGSQGDDESHVIEVDAGATHTFGLTGLTLAGGLGAGLRVDGGEVSMWDAAVVESVKYGVESTGVDSIVSLANVEVSGSERVDNYMGWGVVAAHGGSLFVASSTVRDNSGIGVYARDAGTTVDLVDVDISDTRADDLPGIGLGILADGGAFVSVDSSRIHGNLGTGIELGGDGTVVQVFEVEVSDTMLVEYEDRRFGNGVAVFEGASIDIFSSTIRDSVTGGVYVRQEGSTAFLTDSLVSDTLGLNDGSIGSGVRVEEGGFLYAKSTTIRDNLEGVVSLGVGVSGKHANAVLFDVLVASNHPVSPLTPYANSAGWGGRLEATSTQFVDNSGTSLTAMHAGTSVILRDSAVIGGKRKGHGMGWGVQVNLGAHLTATNVDIEDNWGVGLIAESAGTSVSLRNVEINRTRDSDDQFTSALQVGDGALVTVASSLLSDSEGFGVIATSGASVHLKDVDLRNTKPDPDGGFGHAIWAFDGAWVTLTKSRLVGNCDGILAADEGTLVDVLSTEILEVCRGTLTNVATGLASQASAVLLVTDTIVSGVPGPGLYSVSGGVLECTGCTLTDNGFAGGVVIGGSMVVKNSELTANGRDVSQGGGVGLFAWADALVDRGYPTVLTVESTEVHPHELAAIWLSGPGSYELRNNTLAGGFGSTWTGMLLHGDAVVASDVGAWTGAEGLSLEGNELFGSVGAGLFLERASAALTGNTFHDNSMDVVQQRCNPAFSVLEDVDDASSTLLCPPPPFRMTEPLDFYLYVETVKPEDLR